MLTPEEEKNVKATERVEIPEGELDDSALDGVSGGGMELGFSVVYKETAEEVSFMFSVGDSVTWINFFGTASEKKITNTRIAHCSQGYYDEYKVNGAFSWYSRDKFTQGE